MGFVDRVRGAFGLRVGGGQGFEAASRGRRMRGINPSRNHINVQLAASGETLVARARWLYENDGYGGNAVDEWTSAVIGDGIKPRPRKLRNKAKRRALLDLFFRWTEEADAEERTDFYGLQEKIAREAYLAGECFARLRSRRPGDMQTVPFQVEIYPTEMLDLAFDADLGNGRYIRAGIEFNAIGRRTAYHFFRSNPSDYQPGRTFSRERVRVPAADVIHVYDGRQAGQLRGNTRIARVLVKLFSLETYDDAELDRKKNGALFTAFLIGRGENPIVDLNEDDDDGEDEVIGSMEPGAIVDLGDDKDIKFSQPTEVGGSYEPFQYRTLLKICAGLGVPYSIVTGDVTRGNFSNVRTSIVQFRRRVSQWQNNTMIFQFCRPVWDRFVRTAVLAGLIDQADYDKDPSVYHSVEWLAPVAEWIDPEKDVNAEIKAVENGFKSRSMVVAQRGYDREDLDDEIEEERKDAKRRGLKFGSAAPASPPIGHNGGPPIKDDEAEDGDEAPADDDADDENEDATDAD